MGLPSVSLVSLVSPLRQVPLQDEPVAVVLSRQALPTLDRQKFSSASGLHRGGPRGPKGTDPTGPDRVVKFEMIVPRGSKQTFSVEQDYVHYVHKEILAEDCGKTRR